MPKLKASEVPDPEMQTARDKRSTANFLLKRITFNLIQIEGDPRQESRWLCCVSPVIR